MVAHSVFLEDQASPITLTDVIGLVVWRLAQFESTGACVAYFTGAVRLRWHDELLPEVNKLDIDSSADHLRILGYLNGLAVFSIEGIADKCQIDYRGTSNGAQIPKSGSFALLDEVSLPKDVVIEDEFHSIFRYPPLNNSHKELFNEPVNLLQKMHVYDTWVSRVIRNIVVCETIASRTRSSSWVEAPGMILVSIAERPYLLAEMLVHEACHQYYNIVQRVGDVTDKSDQRLYFSPAVNRPRPLNKLLLGYHAFANVLLFYRAYIEHSGRYESEVAALCAQLTNKLELFEQHLADSTSLTDIGVAIFKPLSDSVNA